MFLLITFATFLALSPSPLLSLSSFHTPVRQCLVVGCDSVAMVISMLLRRLLTTSSIID